MKSVSFWVAIVGLLAMTVSCSGPDANYEALAKKNIQCPEGSHLEYQPWGKSGLEAVCLQRHGPIVIAEYGRIQIEGQYADDKQVGEWRWFDESGKVVRTERHDASSVEKSDRTQPLR